MILDMFYYYYYSSKNLKNKLFYRYIYLSLKPYFKRSFNNRKIFHCIFIYVSKTAHIKIRTLACQTFH